MLEFHGVAGGRETGRGSWDVEIPDGWDPFPNGVLGMATVAALIRPLVSRPTDGNAWH